MYLVKNDRSPFYQVIYKNKLGKLTSMSTGKKLKSEALIFLSELQDEQNKIPEIRFTSLSEFKDEYLKFILSRYSKNYHRSIKLSLDQLQNNTGDLKLNQIDYRLVENYINGIKSKSLAALYYRSLKAAFQKALSWGYISENPFKKFKAPPVPQSFPVFINYNQLCLIVSAADTDMMKDIFNTAFFTGLRLGELVNLKWAAVDFINQVITVQNTQSFTTKSKKERSIPINKALFGLLKKRYPKIIDITRDDFVFSKIRGIKLNEDYVSKAFKAAVIKAKLDSSVHFHTLRHSFASNLIQKGVSLYVVKELLGHSDISITQIYAHLNKGNLFEAVNLLEPEKLKAKKTRVTKRA